jgi:hypothetical protein
MQVKVDPEANQDKRADLSNMETYVDFRTVIMKPPSEDAHLRHILRFYVARSLANSGYADVYIQPQLEMDGQSLEVDVAAVGEDMTMLAICETESVTDETIQKLEALKDADQIGVIIVYSQFGDHANVPDRFKEQVDSRKFLLTAVVPPPFDDVYEYDIWMFETTFRNILEDEL